MISPLHGQYLPRRPQKCRYPQHEGGRIIYTIAHKANHMPFALSKVTMRSLCIGVRRANSVVRVRDLPVHRQIAFQYHYQ